MACSSSPITSCALLSFEIQKAPLKPGQAVVFDIDGTLTPSRLAIYTAREDAAKAVRVFADAGYKIIYLSARTQLFQSGIPNWLKENHFPEGSINVPQTDKDSSDHAAFKERVLNAYKKNGWTFVAAYGDSVTDSKPIPRLESQRNVSSHFNVQERKHAKAIPVCGINACTRGLST